MNRPLPKTQGFALVLAFILCFKIQAQQNKNVFNSTLWIKNELPAEKNSSGAVVQKSEAEMNRYFNFNPAIDFSKQKLNNKFKGIVKKESTVFVVFKSPDNNESNLLLIENGGLKTYFTSQKIQCDTELAINKGDAAKGILLTYICNKNSILSKKKGSITIDDLFYRDQQGKSLIMELIYIPNAIDKSEKYMIESYLSIKYGISLSGEADYYNSDDKKIWSYKDNSAFNKRVTGIGRDDFFGLNQRQSGNSEKDGLSIGFGKLEQINAANKSTINDKSFFIWGDNDQPTLISQNDGAYKKMKRIWRAHSLGATPTTQITISKEQMILSDGKRENQNNEEFLWLAIDSTQNSGFSYATAKFIKARENETHFIFDKVAWQKDTTSNFTFVKAPDFFLVNEAFSSDCNGSEKGRTQVKIVGGVAPFDVYLTSGSSNYNERSSKTDLSLNDLSDGDYILEITDSRGQKQKTNFTIDGLTDAKVYMPTQWQLGQNQTTLIRPIIGNPKEIQSYEWYQGDKFLSSEKEVEVKVAGKYRLELTSTKGCVKSFDFAVLDNKNHGPDSWTVFPNPAKANENFTIRFNFEQKQQVSFAIYDTNGKEIKAAQLGAIKEMEYKDNLRVSGVYFVVVNKDGISETSKLIVE